MEQKNCKNCGQRFEMDIHDLAIYKKMEVPEPTWCPSCRHLRRHASINDYVYYTRTCDKCGKSVISIHPPKSEYKVYCGECWWGDERDDKAQGRDYDFSRGFFEQFDELMHATPQLAMIGMNNENCDYCESVGNCKNSYLISESSNCEDCMYSYWIQKSTDCLDSTYLHECEKCYECIYCFNCYNLKYSQNCFGCSDSYFLDNCVSCKNCMLSTNLRHKEYYIFNKSYSKEEYFEELKKMDLENADSIVSLRKKFQEFLKTQPRKNLQIENVENCSGDYIRNAKNCRNVYHCYEAEECAYGEHVWRNAKYCYDSNTAGRNAELLYETTNSGLDSYNVKFSRYCWGCHDTEYSLECKNGKKLFGCVSLKPGSKYCILNKEYSPEDYEKMVAKIKEKMTEDGEYGEFFPVSISMFGYNNSVSYDEFPLTKDEVLKKGWKWEDRETGSKGKGTVDMEKVPRSIEKVDDSILKEVLTCEKCEKNYKLIPHELEFYKKAGIPLPFKCPDCRHRERLAAKNKKALNPVPCAQCGRETETTLDPAKFEKILCEKCYQKTVY